MLRGYGRMEEPIQGRAEMKEKTLHKVQKHKFFMGSFLYCAPSSFVTMKNL